MPLVVGEAEVIIRANTAGLDTELAASGDAGLASLGSKADKAGEDVGKSLSTGVSKGAKDIGKTAEKDLEQSTGRMKGLLNDLGNKASGTLQGLGVPASLLSGTAALTLGIAGVAAVAVDLGAKMQKANATIAASTGQSIAAVTKIGDAFLTTAGTAQHSAIDMSNAFGMVAGSLKLTEGRALTAKESLDFMNTASDLAVAKGIDLATATTTLAGVMQAFQLKTSQAAEASNILFNASNATGQGIDTLANSMEKLRSKLGDTAPPMAALAALTVDMTKNGITGRAAVTGLNGSVTALAAAAAGATTAGAKSEAVLKALGVSAKQANGTLTPMSEIITKLEPKFKTMTQSQQIATASLIFGSSAAKQMTAVILAGNTAYDAANASVTKHNAVQDAAAKMAHTLSGEMEVLKSTVVDEGVKLGSVLVPALTSVVKAIVPVVTGFADVVGWFAKGSSAAHLVEGAIAVVLAPALIRMGSTAVTQAARSVTAFLSMSAGSKTMATTVATETGVASTSVEGLATKTTGAATVVEADNVAIAASFKTMATESIASIGLLVAKYAEIGAVLYSVYTTYQAIKNPSSIGQGGLLQKIIGTHGISTETGKDGALMDLLDTKGKPIQLSQAQLNALNKSFGEGTLSSSQFDKDALKLTNLNKNRTKNKGAIDALIESLTGSGSGGLNQGTSKTLANLEAISSGQDAYGAVEAATAKHKKPSTAAATKAAEAQKKAEAAAVRAESVLTNEVVSVIHLPMKDALDHLKALGVPASEAAKVLKDATKPFNDAVAALKKAGFTAAEAVKIADAGQKELAAEAKKATAAATAAAKAGVTATTTSLTALMVNGVAVSGAVYRAAIGAAYQIQTGHSINGNSAIAPVPSTSPTSMLPSTPATKQQQTIIKIDSINIHPAPGNDAASLRQTQRMITEAIRQLGVEMSNGLSSQTVVR
jgi:TP901 family phage tail tape measure protein